MYKLRLLGTRNLINLKLKVNLIVDWNVHISYQVYLLSNIIPEKSG